MPDVYARWEGEWVPLVAEPEVESGVIDNFERSPDGVYGPDEGLYDYYVQTEGGDVWTIDEGSRVVEGARSASIDATDDWNLFVSEPGDGLNYYPQEGDVLSGYLWNGSSSGFSAQTFYGWYASTDGNGDCYSVNISTPDVDSQGFDIRRWDDGGTTLLAQDTPFEDEELWFDVETEIRSGGEFVCRLYDVDQSTGERLSPESPRSEISATDTDHLGNDGFAIGNRGTGDGAAVDHVRKVGEGS